MKESIAKKLLQHVTTSYNLIAHEFSDSRVRHWDEFKFYQPYFFEGAEIIDLGCGNGRVIDFLYKHYLSNNFRYVGIDNSEKLLEQALKLHPKEVFLPGDQLSLPIEENNTDLILNIAAFHHIPSYNLRLQALLEMKRVLKPSGVLIISVWNLFQRKYWWENLKAWLKFFTSFGSYAPTDLFIPWKNNQKKVLSHRYYHSFLPSELNNLIKAAGLEIIECYSVKKGLKVPFLKSYNYCVIAKKP